MFSVQNLTQLDLCPSLPWEVHTLPDSLTEKVRRDKKARQDWYQDPGVIHNFYTGVEPANPNARPSKSNPPRSIHALVADYDVPIPEDTLTRGIERLPHKPTWRERSVGGNARLVFVFERPILVDNYEFAVFVLKVARKFFLLDLLPGLDVGALEAPERLYCNGAQWTDTGAGKVPEAVTQALLVECARDYHFKSKNEGPAIPLDVVEAKLRELFPSYDWPDGFTVDTQGPSFWIAESTSVKSAILKSGGFYTFSGHAEKPFYSWADLLGADFVKKYEQERMGEATKDCYFDGRLFWRKFPSGGFNFEAKDDFRAHLSVDKRLAVKPDGSGTSQLDRAMSHVRNHCRVDGAAPMLFFPKGIVKVNGTQILNLAEDNIIRPSETAGEWGEKGNFPFISLVLDNLFEPADQKLPFLAWLRHFYKGALVGKPQAGQNIFLAGGAGVGKTLTNREIVGRMMGGYADARDYIMGEENFGADLFKHPLWALDDETMSDTESNRTRFGSYLKKMTANHVFRYHKKFEHPLMVPWMGRIIITLNLDYTSTRILPTLDNSSADKLSFFRCASEGRIVFPDRYVIGQTLDTELPIFARWLVDWSPGPELLGENRYGTKPHHEASLMEKAHHGSKAAPFTEILVDFLTRYFKDTPGVTEWRGSVTHLMRCIFTDPTNDAVMRSLKLESVNRYLETVHKDGLLACRVVTGDRKSRVWVFDRFDTSAHLSDSPNIPQGSLSLMQPPQ